MTTDDATHLRALLAEQTARAERAEADEQRWRQAVAMLLRHEPEADVRSLLDGIVYDVPEQWCRVTERDQALAANAELRAALESAAHRLDIADGAFTKHWACDFGRFAHEAAEIRALLSRPDLGAGMVVVEREVVEKTLCALLETPANRRTRTARVEAGRALRDALLDGGKGRG